MFGSLRPQPDARSVVEAQMPAFRLLSGDLQRLASPDPLDTLPVRRPTGATQQRRNPAISVAAILTGKLDDVRSQRSFIIGCRWFLSLRRSVLSQPGMPVSRRCQARPSHDQRMRGDGRGLEISLCGLGQDQLVQRQIGDSTSKTIVLDLQLLQPLHLIAFQATVFIPP